MPGRPRHCRRAALATALFAGLLPFGAAEACQLERLPLPTLRTAVPRATRQTAEQDATQAGDGERQDRSADPAAAADDDLEEQIRKAREKLEEQAGDGRADDPAGSATPAADAKNPAGPSATPLPRLQPPPAGGPELPIDWPTVLQLSRASSLEVQLAAEKVREANLAYRDARSVWIPDLKVGTTVLHHEGRDQLIPGQIIDVSRSSVYVGPNLAIEYNPAENAAKTLRARQNIETQTGAWERASREALRDASQAYIDLVAAQAGVAIADEVLDLIGELVDRAEKLEEEGQVVKADVYLAQSNYQAQEQTVLVTQGQQVDASAQLARKLNMRPGTFLYAGQEYLVPVQLVDEATPSEVLLAQSVQDGPGLREVRAVLDSLDELESQATRIALLPTVRGNVISGVFGGGTGSTLDDYNGKTAASLEAYWNLTDLLGVGQKREILNSQRRQAFTRQDGILADLAFGIQMARTRALRARQRIAQAEQQVRLALLAYQSNQERLQEAADKTGPQDVSQSIEALGQGRKNYLQAVIDYNKAQINLQYLLGTDTIPPAMPPGTQMAPCPPLRRTTTYKTSVSPYRTDRQPPVLPSGLVPVSPRSAPQASTAAPPGRTVFAPATAPPAYAPLPPRGGAAPPPPRVASQPPAPARQTPPRRENVTLWNRLWRR